MMGFEQDLLIIDNIPSSEIPSHRYFRCETDWRDRCLVALGT